MPVKYNAEQRAKMIEQLQGKTVEELEYVEEGDQCYWVALLDDGTEFSFRFMAELV